MGKEVWIHWYECAIEDISYEMDIEMDEAEKILQKRLDDNPNYLDGYGCY